MSSILYHNCGIALALDFAPNIGLGLGFALASASSVSPNLAFPVLLLPFPYLCHSMPLVFVLFAHFLLLVIFAIAFILLGGVGIYGVKELEDT